MQVIRTHCFTYLVREYLVCAREVLDWGNTLESIYWRQSFRSYSEGRSRLAQWAAAQLSSAFAPNSPAISSRPTHASHLRHELWSGGCAHTPPINILYSTRTRMWAVNNVTGTWITERFGCWLLKHITSAPDCAPFVTSAYTSHPRDCAFEKQMRLPPFGKSFSCLCLS